MIIGSVYRPPGTKTPVEEVQQYTNNVVNFIQFVMKKFPSDTFVIGGDFNLPDICWETLTIKGSQYTQKLNKKWLELVTDKSLRLKQWIQFPTRKDSTLDLIFTNRPNIKPECKPIRPGVGDHDVVSVVQPIDKPQIMKIINNNIERESPVEKISQSFINNFNMQDGVNKIFEEMSSQLEPILAKHVDEAMRFFPPSMHSRFDHPNWLNAVSVRQEAIKKNKFYIQGYQQRIEKFKEQYHAAKKAYQENRVKAFKASIENLFKKEVPKDERAPVAEVIQKVIENMENNYRHDSRHDYHIVEFLKAHAGAISSMLEVLCCACEHDGKVPKAWNEMYDKPIIRSGMPQTQKNYVPVAFRCMISRIVQDNLSG